MSVWNPHNLQHFLHLPLETSQAFPFHPNSGLPHHCRFLSTLLCICVHGVRVSAAGNTLSAQGLCVLTPPRTYHGSSHIRGPNKHLVTIWENFMGKDALECYFFVLCFWLPSMEAPALLLLFPVLAVHPRKTPCLVSHTSQPCTMSFTSKSLLSPLKCDMGPKLPPLIPKI